MCCCWTSRWGTGCARCCLVNYNGLLSPSHRTSGLLYVPQGGGPRDVLLLDIALEKWLRTLLCFLPIFDPSHRASSSFCMPQGGGFQDVLLLAIALGIGCKS